MYNPCKFGFSSERERDREREIERERERSLSLQPAEIYMFYFSRQRIQKIYKLLTLHARIVENMCYM